MNFPVDLDPLFCCNCSQPLLALLPLSLRRSDSVRNQRFTKRYKPDPVRRVMIRKASGDGERPLGIPTVRDRVVQTAAKIVLEPIFEADFEDTAYGYRPRRGAVDAVKEVHRHIVRGYTD